MMMVMVMMVMVNEMYGDDNDGLITWLIIDDESCIRFNLSK